MAQSIMAAVLRHRIARASLVATCVLVAGCVPSLIPETRESAEAEVVKAETALGQHNYFQAQLATQRAASTFRKAATEHELSEDEIGQQDSVLWARLVAVHKQLDHLVVEAPKQLPQLATEPDARRFASLAELFMNRESLWGEYRRSPDSYDVTYAACVKAAAARLTRSDLAGAQRLIDVSGCSQSSGKGNAPRLVVALLSGKPGCAGFDEALQEFSMIWDSGEDVDSLRDAVLNRGDECVKELAKPPPDRVAELATLGSGVLSALEKMRLGDREKNKSAALKAALAEGLAPLKSMASSQDEQRLAQVRADLAKAVAAKDIATACALARKNSLPIPDELRTAEKAALARLEPHFQKVKDAAHWPATAVLHNLWLGRVGQSQSLPAAVRRWESPIATANLDWSDVVLSDDCSPFGVHPEKIERGWRVIDVVCQPEQGQTVTTDIYETYTATAPLLLHGEVRGKTYQRKVGTRTGVLNARTGAVTVVVAVPFGDGEIKLGATQIVANVFTQVDRGFGFGLAALANKQRGEPGHDIPGALHRVYRAEINRYVASWRQLTKEAKDEDTREEAFARLALIDGKDEAALAYFRKRYALTGNEARTLTPPEVPKPCP